MAIDDTLRYAFIQPADVDVGAGDERMSQSVDLLREASIPLDDDARHELSEDEVARNRLLRGYLADDGWEAADALDLHGTTSDA